MPANSRWDLIQDLKGYHVYVNKTSVAFRQAATS